MTYHLDDREDFKVWLEGFRPRQHVGKAVEAGCCPLAKYLSARFGGEYWVDGFRVWPQSEGHHPDETPPRIPEWAERFLDEVDRAGRGTVITARRALELLEKVPHE